MDTKTKRAAIEEYVAKHLRLVELSKAEHETFAIFAEEGIELESDSVDYIHPQPLRLEIYVKSEHGVSACAVFNTPDTRKIVERLGEAYWASGFPDEFNHIVSVLKTAERSWELEMLGPIKDGLRPDVGLRIKFKSMGPVSLPAHIVNVSGFTVLLPPDGRPFEFDFETCEPLHEVPEDGKGEPRICELDFLLKGLNMYLAEESVFRLPDTWGEVFEGELEEAWLYLEEINDLDVPFEVTAMQLIDLETNEPVLEMSAGQLDRYNKEIRYDRAI